MIEVERDGPVTCLTIARPEVRNALSVSASLELSAAIDAFEADATARVAILTGSGTTCFCAGADLKSREAGAAAPATGFGGLTFRFDRTKPIIAAVNGVAFGGGFELALACDLILAADTASFALPEPRRGLIAAAGGLHRLPRAIGEKRALGLILMARAVSAIEGERLGFVNEVLASDALLPRARALAAEISALAPLAIRASLDAVRRGLAEPSLEAAMRAQPDWPSVKAVRGSQDRREGIEAFREGRPPVWRGR
ncbi:MAG TPA: enoyl-CoA hydratase-related protein [Allosphingosinicella sp.]|nr:enoyl-CoA hydratase-related protein [Allosphingosinicella sp.]